VCARHLLAPAQPDAPRISLTVRAAGDTLTFDGADFGNASRKRKAAAVAPGTPGTDTPKLKFKF
jgi:hypothetical protein